jgi:hypothetical protein
VDLSSVGDEELQCESDSTKTLLASIRTIQELTPSSFTLENVGGCPAQEVIDFLKTHLPQYICIAFRLNALDYGSAKISCILSVLYRLPGPCPSPKFRIHACLGQFLLKVCFGKRAGPSGVLTCCCGCTSQALTLMWLTTSAPNLGSPSPQPSKISSYWCADIKR